MERFADSGTQTEAVVVLSLAQAAVLGLVSETEFFGARLGPGSLFSGLAPREELQPPEGSRSLEHLGQGPAESPEEDGLEAEAPFGKQARRRKRPPVRLVPKAEQEGGEQEEEACQTAASQEDMAGHPCGCPEAQLEEPGHEQSLQSGATRMIDLGTFPQKLRQLRRRTRQERALCEERPPSPAPASPDRTRVESTKAFSSACSYRHSSPSPSEMPCSPPPQSFGWQEPGGLEADATGENSKKVQLDRLDINVQIDDSYLVEKRWQCRLCEKSYTSKYNLVTHILGHNGVKPHSCPHCSKLFKQPSHLQTHLLTHQGTRPHKCEVCEKAFTQTSHLKRHMLLHSDVKPYSCRFCGRGFAYPSELKAHEGKHQSGRCHVCVECGLDFSTLTQLKRHLATHQGPTLYTCPECSKGFPYRSQLQNHLLKHQNVRPFVCSECGMEFSQIHHLKQHSLTHKVCPGAGWVLPPWWLEAPEES